MSYKKVGGIHFFKLWRFRCSFCMAAPVASFARVTSKENQS